MKIGFVILMANIGSILCIPAATFMAYTGHTGFAVTFIVLCACLVYSYKGKIE